jgi:hypothetical protein
MPKEYDVFISFKNFAEDGTPTRDSVLAQQLYEFLQSRGLKVFFSNTSLESLGIAAFKKAIDDALDSAQILVAVGTSQENLEAQWVRYEWDSFFSDILSGNKPKGRVFTYIENLAPSLLPRTLRNMQAIVHGSAPFERLYNFIVNGLGPSNVALSPPDGDIQLAVTQMRSDIERHLLRIKQIAARGGQIDSQSPLKRLDELVEAGIIPADLARNLISFLDLSEREYVDFSTAHGITHADFVNAASIAAQLKRYRKVIEMEREFDANGLWHMRHLRPKEVQKYYYWSAVAVSCPEFDYDYDIYWEAAQRHNSRLIESMGVKCAQRGLIDILPLEDYITVLEFRELELTRLLNAYNQGQEAFSVANEWQWPKEWGDVGWNGPIVRGWLRDAERELMETQNAIKKYRKLAAIDT